VLHITDSHTHLDSEKLAHDQDGVVARANAAGVSRLITIGASGGLASAHRAVELASRYPCVWATVGVHPHDAMIPYTKDELVVLAKMPKVVGIGETGLDFYRDWSPKEKQVESFKLHINVALELGKPLVIHSREAGEECLTILEKMGASKVGGVFHCYAEDAEFAKRLRAINFLVSFPGTLTFKKAEQIRAICQAIPLDQIMVETDAPYMAPEPYRGKVCEPSYVIETLKTVARVKSLSLEEAALATTKNALLLFKGMN
jgi:TatD DNase family protein